MISTIKLYLIGGVIVALLALGTGIYLKGRSDQSSVYKTKEAQQTIKDIRKARGIENEVNKLSPAGVNDGLDKWLRD